MAGEIDRACRTYGFFRITGHGVAPARLAELDRLARELFAQPAEAKAAIAMEHGGSAWRGWFPLDGELTSGVPDHKEGIYFGTELGPDRSRRARRRPVARRQPVPGPPAGAAGRPCSAGSTRWTRVGAELLRLVAAGLGLPATWFEQHVTADPTILFRIFRYPPEQPDGWGVAEHTDYGLLTILATDDHDGLQVHAPDGWIDVPSDPAVFVVNLGDMLERMTEGRYRSTPHRVRNTGAGDRLSFPCFIDPSWDAVCPVLPLGGAAPADEPERRWDGTSVRGWDGTYGDYLTAKVARVFPDLFARLSGPQRPRIG